MKARNKVSEIVASFRTFQDYGKYEIEKTGASPVPADRNLLEMLESQCSHVLKFNEYVNENKGTPPNVESYLGELDDEEEDEFDDEYDDEEDIIKSR